MLDDEISAISSTISSAPKEQDDMLSELREEMADRTSRKYLDDTMAEIGKRSEESLKKISG